MLRTGDIVTAADLDGKNLTDEQKASLQSKLTEEFQHKLRQKLTSFDDINKSIRFFNIIHSKLDDKVIDFTYFNAPGFDFFDSMGNWNKNAKNIKENTIVNCDGLNFTPFYDVMCAKINAVLYPEILHENDGLTDKEKLILSAVVDEIQSEMSRKYVPDSSKIQLNDILCSVIIDEMIFQATYSAVKNVLPELDFLIAIPASFESVDISAQPLPPIIELTTDIKPLDPLPSTINPHLMFNGKANQHKSNKSTSNTNDDHGCKCVLF